MAALNFERPLLALQADVSWLENVRKRLASGKLTLSAADWQGYEYLDPPDPNA